jgi:hypothetical protein
MAALSPEYTEILRRELSTQYVPHLPPLLPTNLVQPPEKQINRALSAFAIHTLFGVSAQVASKAVIDDFQDNGIDAIYYQTETETLHLFQSKFKSSEDFKQEEAQDFCVGVKLLLNKAFTASIRTSLTVKLRFGVPWARSTSFSYGWSTPGAASQALPRPDSSSCSKMTHTVRVAVWLPKSATWVQMRSLPNCVYATATSRLTLRCFYRTTFASKNRG